MSDMSDRRRIKMEVAELPHYCSLDELEGIIIRARARAHQEDIIDLEIEPIPYKWSDGEALWIVGRRWETDVEVLKRRGEEAATQVAQRMHELSLLEQLKKKYEGEGN